MIFLLCRKLRRCNHEDLCYNIKRNTASVIQRCTNLFQALVISTAVMFFLPSFLHVHLHIIQNEVVWLVFNKLKRSHVTLLMLSLRWLSVALASSSVHFVNVLYTPCSSHWVNGTVWHLHKRHKTIFLNFHCIFPSPSEQPGTTPSMQLDLQQLMHLKHIVLKLFHFSEQGLDLKTVFSYFLIL